MITASKPHPRSYRPDLPLGLQMYATGERDTHGRAIYQPTASLISWADKLVREHEHARPAPAPRVHPRSYRPDLPTRGFSCAQLMRATPAERAQWEARPLTYAPASQWPYVKPCEKCHGKACRGRD
jgi:hypothetical protein